MPTDKKIKLPEPFEDTLADLLAAGPHPKDEVATVEDAETGDDKPSRADPSRPD